MHLSQATLLALPALAYATITINTTIETESDTYWSAPLLPSAPISSACSAAYAREIPCDDWLLRFQGISLSGASYNESDINQSRLSGLCTDTCIAGLRSYRDNLRSACTSDDKAAAAPALDITSEDSEQAPQYGATHSSTSSWDGSERARYYMASFLNESRYMTEYIFYMPCMTDLPTGDYCITLPEDNYYMSGSGVDNTTSPSSPEGQAFCNSTCYTQEYAFMLDIAAPTLPELIGQTDIVNVTQFCPGIDTSKYPFLPQNSGSSSSSSSSGSGSSSSSGSASGNSTQEGAAAVLAVGTGGAMWGFMAVLCAVVVGFNGL